MKIGIMQPYFMPYLGYWQHINSVDVFVLYDDVNFIKKGWINRNRIINAGKEYMFSLPLRDISQNRLINDHYFMNNDGKTRLWNIVYSEYHKLSEWKNVSDILESVIKYDTSNLVDYIANSIEMIDQYLDIHTKVLRSSNINNNKRLKGQEKILEICEMIGADTYINPSGGIELYDRELFMMRNIDLQFIFPNLIEYCQTSAVFIPGLSMIDIMCSNTKEWIKEQLDNYMLN